MSLSLTKLTKNDTQGVWWNNFWSSNLRSYMTFTRLDDTGVYMVSMSNKMVDSSKISTADFFAKLMCKSEDTQDRYIRGQRKISKCWKRNAINHSLWFDFFYLLLFCFSFLDTSLPPPIQLCWIHVTNIYHLEWQVEMENPNLSYSETLPEPSACQICYKHLHVFSFRKSSLWITKEHFLFILLAPLTILFWES